MRARSMYGVSWRWALLAPLVLAGCGLARDGGARASAVELTDLSGSLDPVAAWFDEHAGHPRALLILSPV